MFEHVFHQECRGPLTRPSRARQLVSNSLSQVSYHYASADTPHLLKFHGPEDQSALVVHSIHGGSSIVEGTN